MPTSFAVVEGLYIELEGVTGLDWQERASCRDSDTESYFMEGRLPGRLIKRCAACPVAEKCREYAIDRSWIQGMWGGTTGKQRDQIRRRRKAGLPDTPEEETPLCRKGHPLDEVNAHRRTDGGLRCRQCTRDYWHAQQAKKREAAA
ncbi:WhiB family transcriptional regulator [Glycomyces tenuis]|uniref:WhiB family transcriptional regulator n=1 Tax=Glycomyces tenuis TaxID=58116 RepID=UPI0004208757|nr:WhiB family transcriptional regulator [Glycomyces tenuis]